jgi:hypothetical protein
MSQVQAVAEVVMCRLGNTGREVRVAFVAYRDYNDDPHVESLDFTDDLSAFRTFVKKVNSQPTSERSTVATLA